MQPALALKLSWKHTCVNFVLTVLFYLDLYFKAISENHKSGSSLKSTHKVSKEKINESSSKDIKLASENEDDNDNDNDGNNDDSDNNNDDNGTEKQIKDTDVKSKNRGFKSIKIKTDLCHKETDVKEKKGKRHRKRKKASYLEQTSEVSLEQTRQTSEANVELMGDEQLKKISTASRKQGPKNSKIISSDTHVETDITPISSKKRKMKQIDEKTIANVSHKENCHDAEVIIKKKKKKKKTLGDAKPAKSQRSGVVCIKTVKSAKKKSENVLFSNVLHSSSEFGTGTGTGW